jgi:hypothetical protein
LPVQRWRLTFRRGPDAPDLAQREQQAMWSAMLDAAGLRDPGATEGPKLVHAAPIPARFTADRELADLFLPVRWTSVDLRARLAGAMPQGHELVDVHDVWIGQPALPGLLVAGDYEVALVATPDGPSNDAVVAAARTLLAAPWIDRIRHQERRGNAAAKSNLRPLVDDVLPGPDGTLRMRLRFDPVLGTGRPEEVVGALGVLAGGELSVGACRRERLWLRDETPRPLATTPAAGHTAGHSG